MLSKQLLDQKKNFQKEVAEAYKNEEYESTTIIKESLRTGVPVLGGVALTIAYGDIGMAAMEWAPSMLLAGNVGYALSAPAEIVH